MFIIKKINLCHYCSLITLLRAGTEQKYETPTTHTSITDGSTGLSCFCTALDSLSLHRSMHHSFPNTPSMVGRCPASVQHSRDSFSQVVKYINFKQFNVCRVLLPQKVINHRASVYRFTEIPGSSSTRWEI